MTLGTNPYLKGFPAYNNALAIDIFWNRLTDSTTAHLFTVTAKSSGTFVATAGGYVLVSGAATTDDSGSNFLTVMPILGLGATTICRWSTRLRFSEATQSELYLGFFSQGDTDISGGVTNGIYLRKADGAATLEIVNEKATTETAATVTTIAADTDYDVSVEIIAVSSTKVMINVYLNGSPNAVATLGGPSAGIAAAMYSDEILRFGGEFMSGDATGTRTLRIYPVHIEILNPAVA